MPNVKGDEQRLKMALLLERVDLLLIIWTVSHLQAHPGSRTQLSHFSA